MEKIKQDLDRFQKEGLTRDLKTIKNLSRGKILVDGNEYVNFSSNDYLGLSSHPAIMQAFSDESCMVAGSSASRLMTGSTEFHELLERNIAKFKNKPAALVFNSGYQANVGVISAMFGKGDVIFSDKLNHDRPVIPGQIYFHPCCV